MSSQGPVADHYAQGGILGAISDGVNKAGLTVETVTVEDLAVVDEFHIGGRAATDHLLDQLAIDGAATMLDVGCGIGGASRVLASKARRVIGIDLTPEYVEVGNALNGWLGLAGNIDLRVGSATDMPLADGMVDGAIMVHVGMNIEDKTGLFAEVARVLRPQSVFGVYDIMAGSNGDGELRLPVPWATEAATSHVERPERYREAAAAAGLVLEAELDRGQFAQEFFERLQAGAAGRSSPPPLGLHLLMGPTAATKIQNMVANLQAGLISPVEMVFRKP